MSHEIENIDHGDGRKSVKVHVNKLDVKVDDTITEQAKKFIEEEVLPILGDERVHVIIVHKPTNMSTSSQVERKYVKNYAIAAISGFPVKEGVEKKDEDFILIETDQAGNTVVSPWVV